MSAVKHVKQLLTQVQKRQLQSDYSRQRRRKGKYPPAPPPLERHDEKVIVKATGKAVDKALQLALFLQKQSDLSVEIKTGSVAAIDDIVHNDDEEHEDEAGELPESRIRYTSTIEVAVNLTG